MMKKLVGCLMVASLAVACGDEPDSPRVIDIANNSTTATNAAVNNVQPNNTSVNTTANNVAEPDCVPSREAFEANALPFIEEGCGNCHGAEPQFGAPMSLLDYDALIVGVEGERLVDKMATRLLDRTMPPATSPALGHSALDTLVEWTTCGAQHPDHTDGLVASRPVWTAPAEKPDLPTFDVTATEFAVSPTTLDRYECFVVAAPIDEPRFIRRIEPVIDDSRVLHHALVRIDRDGGGEGTNFRCEGFPPGDDYIYAWAPGQEPLQFPEGGIRVEPGETFVLQIHYNNGAGAQDVRDSSGFRVYHAPAIGKEFGMTELGNFGFGAIPPGGSESVTWDCTVNEAVELVASWPHMHEIGSAFSQELIRQDGTSEMVLELTGWNFEAQLIYDTPHMLQPGDVLRSTCEWENNTNQLVVPGTGTADEMCFDFVYVSPPSSNFCR